ncbi:MAG: autotransporter outer membrane beta-barrel domain-containing protein [Alphaproteobacteria bacterium]
MRTLRLLLLTLLCGPLFALRAEAQGTGRVITGIPGYSLQQTANGVLGLLGYNVVPDVTASSLSISRGGQDDTGLQTTQFGLGFTVDPDFPLYLEGFLGYSRYDPRFVFSEGTSKYPLPTRWNHFSGTVGVGWDFPIIEGLVFRPILNAALGHVETDASLFGRLLELKYDREISFLSRGRMNAYGLGGSLMLDLNIPRPGYEVDLELRYTDIRLSTFGDTSREVRGEAEAKTFNIWGRVRWPMDAEMFGRPLRWVVDFSHSRFFGDQVALGFDHLTKVGGGIEMNVGRYELGVWDFNMQSIRIVARYLFGQNVSGASVGLAVSF